MLIRQGEGVKAQRNHIPMVKWLDTHGTICSADRECCFGLVRASLADKLPKSIAGKRQH